MKCYEEFEHGTGACLVLETQSGKWTFPWASLVAIQWPKPDEKEITICFQRHEVVVVGNNLEPLFGSLSQGRVKCIRTGKEGELSLERISVVSTDEV